MVWPLDGLENLVFSAKVNSFVKYVYFFLLTKAIALHRNLSPQSPLQQCAQCTQQKVTYFSYLKRCSLSSRFLRLQSRISNYEHVSRLSSTSTSSIGSSQKKATLFWKRSHTIYYILLEPLLAVEWSYVYQQIFEAYFFPSDGNTY